MKKILIFILALIFVFIVLKLLDIKSSQVVVKDNTISVNLDGYKETCFSNIDLYKESNNQFLKVENEPISFHYVDDNLSTNYCDVVYCEKIENPYTVKLVEFNKIGERVVPKDEVSRFSGQKLPIYHADVLRGKVKIDIKYFSDSECKIPKTFSAIVEN